MAAATLLCAVVTAATPPAAAEDPEATASIDSVQIRGEDVRVLVGLEGLPEGAAPELDTLEVQVGDQGVAATGELASDAAEAETIQRTAVLALDVSDSMRGERFAAAQEAARAFVEAAPADVQIGLVSFSGDVEEVESPTTDHDVVLAAVDDLTLERQTLLYAGITEALRVAGDDGSRNVLVLSDGKDTTGVPVAPLLEQVKSSKVQLDVVSLEPDPEQLAVLGDLAAAGGGDVLTADPEALTDLFTAQAAALDSQVLVSFAVPSGSDGGNETLSVSIDAAGQSYSDEALVPLPATESADEEASTPIAIPESGTPLSESYLLGGVVAFGVAVFLLLLVALGVLDLRKPATVVDRLSPYQQGGRRGDHSGGGAVPHAESVGLKRQAVEVAERALSGGVQSKLACKLEAAGMKLTAAEWALTHAGIAVVATLGGFLLSGGGLLPAALALTAGAALPWVYLRRKRSKRLKAFDGQLADTLQLLSGSLSAGLSFTQSLDTVVREGSEPVSGEFRRALVEQRLGVDVEEALDGVAQRMQSDDFAWVVMAIRIQRQVGGNLAELLLTVAGTLREREHLRRQVQVLSAEGRFSAWILGGLPPAFVVYLLLARPDYLKPMYQQSLGVVMSVAAGVMMLVGIFWMKKAIKVEV